MERSATLLAAVMREINQEPGYACRTVWTDYPDFPGVRFFSDESLSAGMSRRYDSGQRQGVLILPLTGALEISCSDVTKLVATGSAFFVSDIDCYQIGNPYPDISVNFLQIHLPSDTNGQLSSISGLRNQIQDFGDFGGSKVSVGIFDARVKAELTFEDHLLAYVINGAFEFEDRLLETRDGLLLEHYNTAELESLSAEAIVLLIRRLPACSPLK